MTSHRLVRAYSISTSSVARMCHHQLVSTFFIFFFIFHFFLFSCSLPGVNDGYTSWCGSYCKGHRATLGYSRPGMKLWYTVNAVCIIAANPVYVAMGRRTWLLVTIIVTLQLIVLAWFFLLCQRIKRVGVKSK